MHKADILALVFVMQLVSCPKLSMRFPSDGHTCATLCRWAGPQGGTQRRTPGWGWCRLSENEPQQVTIDTAAPSQTFYHQPHALLPINPSDTLQRANCFPVIKLKLAADQL